MSAVLEEVVTIDFETYSECDIELCGSYVYSEHPSTEILIMSVKFNDEPSIMVDVYNGEKLPERLINHIKSHSRVIAHNVSFEWAIWKNVAMKKLKWLPISNTQWFDTAVQCGWSAIPLSLDNSTKVLDLQNKKNPIGKALLNLLSCPQKDGSRVLPESRPYEYGQLKVYCLEDTDATYDVYMTLLKPKQEEQEINYQLTFNMNALGIPVDVESAKIIYPKILIEKETFTGKLSELTGNVITKVTQTKRMKDWIKSRHGIEMPNFTADTVDKMLDQEGLPDEVYAMLEMRASGGKSSTGKYERLLNMASTDNTIHSVWLHSGTTTGRLVGRAFQPTNLPKPSCKYESMDELIEDLVSMDNDQITEKYGSFMKAASTAIRGLIKPPPGHIMYGADYAAIEARIVFWLADCARGLKNYHNKIDMYKDMAAVIYNIKYEDVDDKQRWLGKQVILGAGFGIGWKGFKNACLNYNVLIADTVCQLAVDTYRDTFFEVPELWESMESAAMTAVLTGKQTFAANGKISFKTLKLRNGQIFLYMKLPSGRLLAYPQVTIEMVVTPWGAKKKAIVYRKWVDNYWRKESTYGGKLTENAVQAIARDIMYNGAHNATKHDFFPIMQVYDELISLMSEDLAEFYEIEKYESIICDPLPVWANGMPIAAEGKILTRYQKL